MARPSYSFKDVTIIIGGTIIDGLDESAGMTFTPDAPLFTNAVDHYGKKYRIKTANRNGKIVLTMVGGSDKNDYLMSLYDADLAKTGAGIVPVFVKDLYGTTLLTVTEAWVEGLPEVNWQLGMQNRVWTLQCGESTMYVGGNGSFVSATG